MKPVPSYCKICTRDIFQTIIKCLGTDWENGGLRWMCQHCGTFFTWDNENRYIRNIETNFKYGLAGNVDVEAINTGRTRFTIDPKLPNDEFDPITYNHNKHFE